MNVFNITKPGQTLGTARRSLETVRTSIRALAETLLTRLSRVVHRYEPLPGELLGRKWFLSDYCLRSAAVRAYLETEGLIGSEVRRAYEWRLAMITAPDEP